VNARHDFKEVVIVRGGPRRRLMLTPRQARRIARSIETVGKQSNPMYKLIPVVGHGPGRFTNHIDRSRGSRRKFIEAFTAAVDRDYCGTRVPFSSTAGSISQIGSGEL
jgi:hypothetical protein